MKDRDQSCSFLFIYFWQHWVFVAAIRLSLVAVSSGYSLVVVCGLFIVVVSLVAGAQALEHGLSSCGIRGAT